MKRKTTLTKGRSHSSDVSKYQVSRRTLEITIAVMRLKLISSHIYNTCLVTMDLAT